MTSSRQPKRFILALVILSFALLLSRCTCSGLTETQAACSKSASSAKDCSSCCKQANSAGWMFSANSCKCIRE